MRNRARVARQVAPQTQATVIALPAGTQTPPTGTPTTTGFQKVDRTATVLKKSNGTLATTAKTKKTTTYNAWEPDYLRDYEAVYPMDKNLLFRVLSVQSESRRTHRMEKFILRFVEDLSDSGMEIAVVQDIHANIYVMKGEAEIYPTIVAHMDTVHDIVPNANYQVRSNGRVMWAMDPETKTDTGVGGDDKVGVFIALSMLRDLPACKAAFFVDEEIGCIGSAKAQMTFFENSAFVLECDRRGNADFVDRIGGTEMYGTEFAAAIKPTLAQFGYKPTSGGMTDVLELKELGLDVAAANMSCGYFMPHTRWETVGLLDVQRCYDLVVTLCTTLAHKRWAHVAPKRTWSTNVGTGGITYGGWEYGDWDAYSDGYFWKDGKIVRKEMWSDPDQSTDRTAKSLADLKRENPHWFPETDDAPKGSFDAAEAIIKGQVSVDQLLNEDRVIIEAAQGRDILLDESWAGSEWPEYPDCPKCRNSGGVVYDNDDEGIGHDYFCLTCQLSFTVRSYEDDETQMPA
jgi:hypothetical protein